MRLKKRANALFASAVFAVFAVFGRCPAAGQGHGVGSLQGDAPGAFGCSGLPVPFTTLALVHQYLSGHQAYLFTK
jgi:hypothetical protein